MIFSVTSRYGMIFLPCLVLFGGFFLRELASTKGWKAWGTVCACLVLAGLPSLTPMVRWDSRIQRRVLYAHDNIEGLLGPRREMAATMESYTVAQAYFPFLPSILDTRGIPFEDPRIALAAARASESLGYTKPPDAYLQAVLWKEAGDCQRAIPLARRAGAAGFFTTDYSRFLDPHLLVAECLLTEGDEIGAMEAVLASLEAHPATADGLAMAIAGSKTTGLSANLVPAWEERLRRIHDPLSAAFSLVQSYSVWEEPAVALEVALSLQTQIPSSAIANYQVALLLAETGEASDAFEVLQQARATFPGLALKLGPFEDTLDELTVADPKNRQAWLAKIDQLAQAGEFREASRVAAEAAGRLEGDEELLQIQGVMARLASQIGS